MNTARRIWVRLLVANALGFFVVWVPLELVVGGARSRDMRFERLQTRGKFKRFDALLAVCLRKHGRYPANLGALSRDVADGWGRPLLYSVRGGKPLIESLGRDGARGGMGTDADLSNRNPKPSHGRLPFWTRVSDADALPATLFCLACGVLTAFFSARLRQDFALKTCLPWALQLLIALGMAFVGAIFITLSHVPSGH